MDELGPESRALLDAAREGLSPDPAAIHRVHGRIHAAAAGAPVGTGVGIKLGIAGVVATVAIVGGFYLRHAPAAPSAMPSIELARPVERPERAAADKATPSSDEDLITIESPSGPIRRGDSNRGSAAHGAPAPLRVAPAAPGAALSRATADDSHRTTAMPSRHAVAIGDSHRAGAAQPAASSPREAAGASPTGIELSREVALIDLAMSALRRDDAAAALRVVQEYAAEAGEGGQLRQDAAAIEIEALCKLGDSGARDKRNAFDARFPHSAQRARLEAACR